jgi:UDP-N-acetylglucosamine/UDP-N-acetyl-alpha-D-glucosaminouronate 4-epimerase
MANFLVTGGAGFIGSNIVKKLVENGENVTVVDNFITGRKENIEPYLGKIKLIDDDLTANKTALEATAGIDYVLHQAAIPSVPRSIDSPLDTNNANINATLNLLVAAKENKVKRVVYAASSSVYGNLDAEQAKVEIMPANPMSPYALQKYASEIYCRLYYELHGLETVCLRYFNVFGPNQDPTSEYSAVIPLFITALHTGKAPTIFGDGTTSRDFTYVENNVEANILAATAKEGAGETFNIAMGSSITLTELVKMINDIMGTNITPNYGPERKGDIKHSQADISKVEKVLGFKPGISFEEGLKKTIEFYTA